MAVAEIAVVVVARAEVAQVAARAVMVLVALRAVTIDLIRPQQDRRLEHRPARRLRKPDCFAAPLLSKKCLVVA